MLGIVGHSGAGKSTIVNLISRLYDATEGQVLIDGINVKDVTIASLRRSVAMVSQETYIFMGSVAQNIAYARPDASDEEIVAAAKAASAHEFIMRMPEGYNTLIGASGRSLSGGERQRISIARAILADPKILILDEATASVDTETERSIQDAIDRLVVGRTTISIAHRLSTLRAADRLIVIENGEVAESGTHAELARKQGIVAVVKIHKVKLRPAHAAVALLKAANLLLLASEGLNHPRAGKIVVYLSVKRAIGAVAASVVVPQRGHHHKAHIKKRGHQHHRYKGQLPGKREHYYHGADNIRSVSKHKGQSVNEEAHYLVCIPVYAGHQSARLTARKEGHRQPA